ncbi:MAG: SusD/RagB family nutrient-binding outer membrane lipoprotein [Bacteroidota bacterium]
MKKGLFFAAFLLLLGLPACDRGFEELNRNPLEPTEVNYEAIFNELVNSLRLGWNRQLFLHNEMLYDLTELGAVTASTFGNIDAGVEEIWSNYYGALKNARELKIVLNELAAADPEATDLVEAQVDILMAYKTFQMLDFFGDIPYSEAAQAYAETAVVRPVYDDDREIYLGLLNDLRTASELLATAPSNTEAGNPYLDLGNFDALLGDDRGRWVKFANSMRLRYLLRIYELETSLVESEIGQMIVDGAPFLGEGEDILMLPADQGWSNLGVNWSFREHNRLRMGTTLWNFLTEDGTILDPRAPIFFETNNAEEWVPFPQVAPAGTPQSGGAPYNKDVRDNVYDNKGEENIYSSFNFYLVRDEQDIPEVLFSAAEVKFLLAEVFLRGIGTAKDESIASFRYREGMLISINFWKALVSNSAIWENQDNAIGAIQPFDVTGHPRYQFVFGAPEVDNLRKIYTQRWVDYFRQPWEAFSLLRQTDLLPREKPSNNFFRFKYPVSETSFNFENWSAQVARMGGDETNIKVWWME